MYYAERASGIGKKECRSFADLFRDVPVDGGLDMDEIVDFLVARHGEARGRHLYDLSIRKGVLHPNKQGHNILIASIWNWFDQKSCPEQETSGPTHEEVVRKQEKTE